MRNFTKPILILLFTHLIFSMKAQSVTVAQGDWTNPSTWAGGVIPSDANSAIINHAVVVNGVAVCKSLEIAATGSLTCSGSDVLTIGNDSNGGNATLKVEGSFTMDGDCAVNLLGSAAFGANASLTMTQGSLIIDGNNGVVANSVADGTPLLSLAATATKNISGGTIRFNDPHAVVGNLLIDGAVDISAFVAVGKYTPTGNAVDTDTNTPFAFGDNINFADVNVNYIKNNNNMTSFGIRDVIKGNFEMTQGGLHSTTASQFEGNITCGQHSVIEGELSCMGSASGSPTTISGTGNFRAVTLQSSSSPNAGSILVENNLIVNKLILNNSIELNGATLTVTGDITGSGIVMLTGNDSGLKRPIAAGSGSTVFPIGLSANDYTPVTISNTTALSYWTIGLSSALKTPPSSTKMVNIQWDIKPSVANTQADINVQWDEANEEAGFNRSSSALHHWNGTSWDKITTSANPSKAGTTHSITKAGWSNFSPFAVFSEVSLPVELISFTGRTQQSKALLSWETASEKNNDGFDVEKSMDGENFEKIGFVKSTGNIQITQYYNFLDYNLTQNAYYRLKQVDADGSFNYSKTITLTNDGGKGKSTIYAYPNPVSDALNVKTVVSETSDLEIVDVVGRVVHKQKVESGNYEIPTSDLVKGVYIVRLTNRNDRAVQKIIKN